MLRKPATTVFTVILGLMVVHASFGQKNNGNGSSPNGQPFQSIDSQITALDARVSELEIICPWPFTIEAPMEEFDGFSQVVCGTEPLYTGPTVDYRQLIQELVLADVCSTKDALTDGLFTTITGLLETGLNTALSESTQLTEDSINTAQQALIDSLNLILDNYEQGVNSGLTGVTNGTNTSIGDVEASLNSVDAQLNLVNDRINDGLNGVESIFNSVANFINSLDNHELLPDFVDEGAVNSALKRNIATPGNLNIPDVDLPRVASPDLLDVETVEVDALELDAPIVDLSGSEDGLLGQVLDFINMCSHPDEYVELILAFYGFLDAVDPNGVVGVPNQVSDQAIAFKMCAVRGGHICDTTELEALAEVNPESAPQTGDWASEENAVIFWPGTRLETTSFPPIQGEATNLFAFPREIPITVSTPVYPTGFFSCCRSTID